MSFVLNKFFDWVKNLFAYFAKVFGFTSSGYFLESDEAEKTKQASAKQLTETEQNKTPVAPTSNRRRPNDKMDYYLKMAREIKKN
ncbi:threonine dehydratase [Nostoc sp. UHCC 0302]|uniref:threonine dehydratase n=1 Tax=Nostoc sp. UHCC 0302 TaxID=3134896 RepID=UPI00311CCA84